MSARPSVVRTWHRRTAHRRVPEREVVVIGVGER